MVQNLKCYRVTMRTLGPVFVGSGREIGKKEYVFLSRGKVGIPDIKNLYEEMRRRGIGNLFEDYLLGEDKSSLDKWMAKQKIKVAEIGSAIRYTIDCGDKIIETGKTLQVMECIKDPYGKPYIPGSSLKGMFRTILLGADLLHSPQKYQDVKQELLQSVERKERKTKYLKRDIAELEAVAYRILRKDPKHPKDAVNDVLQGFVVSDSEPLSEEDLVLCQKVDLHTRGKEKAISILRECIKPDTKITFTITVDAKVCPLTEEKILGAVKDFIGSYYKNFSSAFPGIRVPGEKEVFLGGGCGFVTKTVLYPLLGKRLGMETTQKVFKNTGVQDKHKHAYDKEYGASPHTLKCTRYNGKNYQMGRCRIEQLECIGEGFARYR
ncbi:MAG: type III-A CRISPR-associated RAMP protein Csm5 [Lachnospiraceae bacterium]|nr:type III-A CRISPR-associated RAMP protein Csm5 [Lachnospiraceae bacterium]